MTKNQGYIRLTPDGPVWVQLDEPWIDHDEGVRVIPREDGGFDYEPLDDDELAAWERDDRQPWGFCGCLAVLGLGIAFWGLMARWLLA